MEVAAAEQAKRHEDAEHAGQQRQGQAGRQQRLVPALVECASEVLGETPKLIRVVRIDRIERALGEVKARLNRVDNL